MSTIGTHLLRVNAIRKERLGGFIFTGIPIDSDGNVIDARTYHVAIVPSRLLGGVRINVGKWWRVAGPIETNQVVAPNGFVLYESQIKVEFIEMRLPSGEHIIDLMAKSSDFKGIGTVKARLLWESYGEHLYTVLNEGNVESLSTVVSEETARIVVDAWRLLAVDTRTLQWLHCKGFKVALGRKVVNFYGNDAQAKIEEDPYRLLSFEGAWSTVDTFARTAFQIADDDPRRLMASIEEVLYRMLRDGHTCARPVMVKDRLRNLFLENSTVRNMQAMVKQSLAAGESNGSYVIGYDGTVHPLGALLLETSVATAIAERMASVYNVALLETLEVDALIAEYEQQESALANQVIRLNIEQRLAVHTAASHAITVITGSAGTGKTTVLKALYKVYGAAQIRIYQVALAGRAAMRMQQATDLAASTIASFLQRAKPADFQGPTVLVVDECSMVDIISMGRLCEVLPHHVRLVLVGDPSQLMPVGPGLVLHALAGIPKVPTVELKHINRYGSKIAKAANAIRAGEWPSLQSDENSSITFLAADSRRLKTESEYSSELTETVLRLYQQDPENTQILCARKGGPDGTRELNTLCQRVFTNDKPQITIWNEEHDVAEYTGFNLGDLILCTRNLWDKGLQNGSLGIIDAIESEPRELYDHDGKALGSGVGWAQWDDGHRRPILVSMLEDLELGYAITVHKAQGSQWPRVIVPISGNALLDRTLIYTAVTRAQSQVILIGNPLAAQKAVENLPKFSYRQTALKKILEAILEEDRT